MFNSTNCNSNQKWNDETCQCECENYRMWKKDYSWNHSTCVCENDKYLKSIVDDSKIVCDEIIYVMYIVSTNVANTISANVSTNSDNKNVRYKIDCHILLVTILLLIITITCYYYAKQRSK